MGWILAWWMSLHHYALGKVHLNACQESISVLLYWQRLIELPLVARGHATNTKLIVKSKTFPLYSVRAHPLPSTDQKPTMPELTALQGRTQHINIAQEIGVQWEMVGTTLLDDRNGTIIPAIAQECGNNVERINTEILRRWQHGRGIPDRTWRGLLGVLHVHCTALAEGVEEVLTVNPQQPHPSTPSSTAQTDHSTQPPPHYSPFQPHLPIYFRDYLVKFYSLPKDPAATWPPSPSEIFINLAIINRENVSSKELHKFMLATLDKGVDTILETKAPVEIEQLMDTKLGKKQQCVLVEGAPGVGKTTLSWEICKRWAKGNLFEQYTLLLLLRLRDETVQNAQTVKDLILYPFEEHLEAITQYLKYTGGTHTLILLEGLDELPQHLLKLSSIFTRLLAGIDLPDATILVTSRPSATAQLWMKWKDRITKHIEILGFTEENITAYVANILDQQELPDFNTYLCTAPSIRQLMYIPLHSGIVVELYRMYRDTDQPLPTNKTALYTRLVKTILTRYLAKHPTYKDDDIDVKEFTDLPDDIYPIFRDIVKLAYESVSHQQLIFKDHDKPIHHLGLMDAVAELFPLSRKPTYSYNFLHLSIQEYLGAIHVSLMDTSIQEQLLDSMCSKEHLKNMAMFLAAITNFKGMNWELVKRTIQRECMEWNGILTLSRYSIQIVYESENCSLLEGHSCYRYHISDYSPLFDFTALGYCIATSSYKWELMLGSINESMWTTSGIDLLLQALSHHNSGSYTIVGLHCYHKETGFAQYILAGLPYHSIPLIETLELTSEELQPLPTCLPELVHRMNRLGVLRLRRSTAATLADTLQALATAPTYTLNTLNLRYSQFSTPAMQALCATLLGHSKSVAILWLVDCDLTDDLACLLAKALHRLLKLSAMYLEGNAIGDERAIAIAGALHGLPELSVVVLAGNAIGERGHAALDECTATNKQLTLLY